MKKQNPLILNIPTPCTESLAEMSPSGNGRFCSHCQKTVTDITVMSDTQVVQLFQQQADTHCIRAFASQLNRQITLPPQAPTRFYRIAVALGLTIIMTGAADAYARPKAPLTEQNYWLITTDDSTAKEKKADSSLEVYGVVLDDKGDVIEGVIVKLIQGGQLKGGTVTYENGRFSIKSVAAGKYDLECSAMTFKTVRLTSLSVPLNKPLNFTMRLSNEINGIKDHYYKRCRPSGS